MNKFILVLTLLPGMALAGAKAQTPPSPVVATPTQTGQAANKGYVDTLIAQAKAAAAAAQTTANAAVTPAQMQAAIASAIAALPANTVAATVTGTAGVFSDFISSAILPNTADPVDNSAKPVGWPSNDTGNLTNVASFVFGTNVPSSTIGAIRNRSDLTSHFDLAQINGNATVYDEGTRSTNTGAFTARIRVYPDNNIHNTLVFDGNGLNFKAYCAGNSGNLCQGQDNIVTGYIHALTPVYPKMVVEACMISTGSAAQGSWLTKWLTGGSFPPPGLGIGLYGSDTGAYPRRPTYYLEDDFDDHYPLNDGETTEKSLTPQTPTLGGDNDARQATADVFNANSGGFSRVTGGYRTTTDLSAGVHCYQTEIVDSVYTDSSRTTVQSPGQIQHSLDGVIYDIKRHAWYGGPELSWQGNVVPGNTNNAASNVMIGLQYGPTFDPNSSAAMTPANVSGARAILTSLRFWKRTGGTAPSPTLTNAAGSVPAYTPAFSFQSGSTAATVSGANFYWFNQGSASVSTASGIATLSQASHNGENYAGLVTPITGDVTTLRLRNTGPNANYYNGGLIFAKTGSPASTVVMNLPSLNLFQIISQNTPTSGASQTLYQENSSSKAVLNTDYCVLIWHNGGKYNISYGNCNAGQYVAIASPSESDLGNPSHVGVYVNSNASDGGTGSVQLRGYSAVSGSNTQAAGP